MIAEAQLLAKLLGYYFFNVPLLYACIADCLTESIWILDGGDWCNRIWPSCHKTGIAGYLGNESLRQVGGLKCSSRLLEGIEQDELACAEQNLFNDIMAILNILIAYLGV